MAHDSDEYLVQYLLGELPPGEADRLDELSITDDAIALRLRLLEDDLVDRYVRGERVGGAIDHFHRVQAASPYLREKVLFAEALQTVSALPHAERSRPAGRLPRPRFPRWVLATAAALGIAVAGSLLVVNRRLRNDMRDLQSGQAAFEQQTERVRDATQKPAAAASQAAPVTATFLLMPPRRGLDEPPPIITLPKNVERVALRLQIESDEYVRFWAALKDTASRRIVWRSPDLASETAGADRVVTIVVPADVLSAGRYGIELSGITDIGSTELLVEYPVRVVIQ